MANETPTSTPASDSNHRSKKGIYSLDSFPARFIPPAAIAVAWWLSGIELIGASQRDNDWKILGVAFPVFWLAACGSRLVASKPREASWLAAALVLTALVLGGAAPAVGSYLGHLFYGATHALIISCLGLLTFIAMTRSNKNQTANKSKGAAAPDTASLKTNESGQDD